ncbi:hypothetical protein LSH36_1218g00060 [Paralvinella palmiformis]|uniref:Uncharacterized protein n=1 Tax=Paralvinella palmiformis TaxID=53620 RepID=A0AAD9IUN1_9ANNE|nr:hypothetical protein LSH36_1218g00060 [Paralvinella palmiformis]
MPNGDNNSFNRDTGMHISAMTNYRQIFLILSLSVPVLAVKCYTCRSESESGCSVQNFDPSLFSHSTLSNCSVCKLEYATVGGFKNTNRTCESKCTESVLVLTTESWTLHYQNWCCADKELCNDGVHSVDVGYWTMVSTIGAAFVLSVRNQ